MKKFKPIIFSIIAIVVVLSASSCKRHFAPRPYGYFRIDLPEKEYKKTDTNLPYSFEIPVYAFLIPDTANQNWANIVFPMNHATVYLTYKKVNNDFVKNMEESREFAYKHTVKADAIDETVYNNPEKNIYGIIYDIKGNAASSVQFYISDSTNHFLRGSLYFDTPPNKDSLDPVIIFIRQDIIHLIETATWN